MFSHPKLAPPPPPPPPPTLMPDVLATAAILLVVTALLWYIPSWLNSLWMRSIRTPNFHRSNAKRYRRRQREAFPPPYPNGWYHICNAADVAHGRVHAISALGLDLVAFREQLSGRVGVLSAHCPHLGAHLAEGGMVVGDSIKCPFHGWRFNADGKVVEIPYTRLPAVPERCKTPKYEAAEFLGMVFLWFDAEGRPPAWQLHVHEDLLPGGLHSRHRLVRSRSASFGMHVCEMVENSADAYHFQTLHAPLPVPMLEHVVGCTHTCTQRYPEPPCADADSAATAAAGPKPANTSCGESSPIDSTTARPPSPSSPLHLAYFTERMSDIRLGPSAPRTSADGLSLRAVLPGASVPNLESRTLSFLIRSLESHPSDPCLPACVMPAPQTPPRS
jgi:nitrite reductase/ring-hydroxylating ferredoxin subunit